MKRESKKAPKIIEFPNQPTVYKSECCNQPIDVKTSGIKMRGAGAATKGTMSRGPMA